MDVSNKSKAENDSEWFKCLSCGFVAYGDDPEKAKNSKCLGCGKIMGLSTKESPRFLKNKPLMIECTKCHNHYSHRASECPKCGFKKHSTCVICSKKIPTTSKICPYCADPKPFTKEEHSPPEVITRYDETNQVNKNSDIKSLKHVTKASGLKKNPQGLHNSSRLDQDQSNIFLGDSTHPWRRFWARTVDILSCGILLFMLIIIVISYLFPQYAGSLVNTLENPIIAGIILYLLWIPIEALFLSMFGATPAKWIFGIKVLNSTTDDNLDYTMAIKRTTNVWLQGEGLGIPLIGLVTRLFAYKRLTKTGTTLWDESVNSVVTHKEWGVGRAIFSTLTTIATFIFVSILNNL